jgi:hypothetical protein
VVADARLFAPVDRLAEPTEVERLFEHEGWHIALASRAEDSGAVVRRRGSPDARGIFEGLAAVALDEFRVERAVIEQVHALAESYEQSTEDALVVFTARLLELSDRRTRGGTVAEYYEGTLPAFSSLVKHFAYLAAAHVASSGLRTIGSARPSTYGSGTSATTGISQLLS